jgi:hypothetical protein
MTQGIRENFAHYKNETDEKTIKEVSFNFLINDFNGIFI